MLQAAARHRDWQRQQGDSQQGAAAEADTAALGGLSPKASGSFKVHHFATYVIQLLSWAVHWDPAWRTCLYICLHTRAVMLRR